MKSLKRGKNISAADIQNISEFGIWMLIHGKEVFLSYKEFPWFQNASIKQVYNFEFLHDRHLYWPDLDIDLSVEAIVAPEKFQLKAQRRG